MTKLKAMPSPGRLNHSSVRQVSRCTLHAVTIFDLSISGMVDLSHTSHHKEIFSYNKRNLHRKLNIRTCKSGGYTSTSLKRSHNQSESITQATFKFSRPTDTPKYNIRLIVGIK